MNDVEKLAQALPAKFDFYHLGAVEQIRDASNPVTSAGELRVAVAFRIIGDLRGVFVVLFERGLDLSLYMEMGNIIASRAATELNRGSLDVAVSPPQILSDSSAETLVAQAPPEARRRYLHRHGGNDVIVETVIVPNSANTSGQSHSGGIAGHA